MQCLRDLPESPPCIRAVLSLALARVPPFKTVSELAQAVGRSRSALNKNWKAVSGEGVGLKGFLDLIQLGQLHQLRRWGKSQERRARSCGLHPRTAQRLAGRYGMVAEGGEAKEPDPPWHQICEILGEAGGQGRDRETSFA